MPKLIVVVGTNGSGKSTIVYNLMAKYASRVIYGALGPRYPEAYEMDIGTRPWPLYILGPYHVVTGGTDFIGDFPTIMALARKYRKKGHVLLEGLIIGGYVGKVGDLLDESGKDAAVLMMDTPLEVCIERVNARRAAKGNSGEINPRHIIKKHEAIERTQKRYIKAGVNALEVSPENGADVVLELCREKVLTE